MVGIFSHGFEVKLATSLALLQGAPEGNQNCPRYPRSQKARSTWNRQNNWSPEQKVEIWFWRCTSSENIMFGIVRVLEPFNSFPTNWVMHMDGHSHAEKSTIGLGCNYYSQTDRTKLLKCCAPSWYPKESHESEVQCPYHMSILFLSFRQ